MNAERTGRPFKQAIQELFIELNDTALHADASLDLSHPPNLVRRTGGLRRGKAWVIVSEPGGGARSLGISLLLDALGFDGRSRDATHRTAFWLHLAAPERRVAAELLASYARIPLRQIERGDLHRDAWGKLTHAAGVLAKSALWLSDEPLLDPSEPPDVAFWDLSADHAEAIRRATDEIPHQTAHVLVLETDRCMPRSAVDKGDVSHVGIDAIVWKHVDWLLVVSPVPSRDQDDGPTERFLVAVTRPWIGQGACIEVELPNVEVVRREALCPF